MEYLPTFSEIQHCALQSPFTVNHLGDRNVAIKGLPLQRDEVDCSGPHPTFKHQHSVLRSLCRSIVPSVCIDGTWSLGPRSVVLD